MNGSERRAERRAEALSSVLTEVTFCCCFFKISYSNDCDANIAIITNSVFAKTLFGVKFHCFLYSRWNYNWGMILSPKSVTPDLTSKWIFVYLRVNRDVI